MAPWPDIDSPALFLASGLSAAAFAAAAAPEQACLGAAMLAGCVRALQERGRKPRSWAALAIYGFAAAALLAAAARRRYRGPWLLSLFALASLALHASRLPRLLPASHLLPWPALAALAAGCALGGPDARAAAGLGLGRLSGGPLAWAGLCALLSTGALVAWSLWVRGGHGPIQDALGPQLSPGRIALFAAANAFGEEAEFRMLGLGGLVAEPTRCPSLWPWLAVTLHAAFFATLHVTEGFPSGANGGVLVFLWAVFLGILRLWTGGMALVFLLHVQADAVIFSLVLAEEGRRRRRGAAAERGAERGALAADATERGAGTAAE